MSWRRTMDSMKGRTPGPMRAVERRMKHEGPLEPVPLTERQMANRIEPLFGLIARGEIPVESNTPMARALGRAVEKLHRQQENS